MTIRNVLIGGAALSTAAIGYLGHWTHEKSAYLPKAQQGNFGLRMHEVATSLFTAKSINDEITARNHTALVASLASKKSTKIASERLIQDLYQPFIESFILGGNTKPPVFSYHEGKFYFSGVVNRLHSRSARQEILDGEYILAKATISTFGREKHLAHTFYPTVILTGTTDPMLFQALADRLLEDSRSKKQAIELNRTEPIETTIQG